MHANPIPKPWKAFIEELDTRLTEPVILHCLGGFVIEILHGLPRSTADIDALSIRPNDQRQLILNIAGKESPLHKKHKLYVDFVTVAPTIYNYEDRLTDVFRDALKNLRLFVLDPYDLALAKIERNSQKDRDDVKLLARTIPFDLETLRERYQKEVRPYLGNPKREDLTLALWLEAISEERGEKAKQ